MKRIAGFSGACAWVLMAAFMCGSTAVASQRPQEDPRREVQCRGIAPGKPCIRELPSPVDEGGFWPLMCRGPMEEFSIRRVGGSQMRGYLWHDYRSLGRGECAWLPGLSPPDWKWWKKRFLSRHRRPALRLRIPIIVEFKSLQSWPSVDGINSRYGRVQVYMRLHTPLRRLWYANAKGGVFLIGVRLDPYGSRRRHRVGRLWLKGTLLPPYLPEASYRAIVKRGTSAKKEPDWRQQSDSRSGARATSEPGRNSGKAASDRPAPASPGTTDPKTAAPKTADPKTVKSAPASPGDKPSSTPKPSPAQR